MVFQNLALFPHMNVNQNVAYGMRARGVSRAESRARTVDALDMVALGGLGRRQVAELSGGQQQRVALARALVTEPRVLLLDEPLSALDLQLRQQMQVELKKLQQRVGTTFVFVTHDQDEAMAMSDRIAVLNGGQVEQVGTPNELYQRPASRFVADFVGDSNLLDGVADAQDGKTTLVGAGLSAYLPRSIPPGQQVTLCVRPESISVNAAAPDHDCRVRGLISASVYRGSSVRLFVASEAGFEFLADVATTHAGVPVGSTVELSWRSRDSWAVTENVPSDDEMAPY
jgi:ABC-type Fe3+/spermidine/putrescine transport system ATPase subunit